MFPFPIAKKQKCDIQQFYSSSTWNKPPGVSHVYMLLIGGGGTGDGTTGGGSSSVHVWYGAAQNVPDSLVVTVSFGDSSASTISYRGASSNAITFVTAGAGSGINAGPVATANYFSASGFFSSIDGQAGSASNRSVSGTTFLSGGANNINVTANYGYKTTGSGYFQLQPIIVGVGGVGGRNGGIGCGGGSTGIGGRGFVLIASW
jgi:hypothetical protein